MLCNIASAPGKPPDQTYPTRFHGNPVSTWPRSHSAALHRTANRQIRAAGGEVARATFELGKAEDRLLALADDADVDLLVVGARGEEAPATRRMLGGVSDHIVARSPRPVLVVK